MVLEPWKNISDYHKLVAAIKINIVDLKNTDVEYRGKTLRTNQSIVHGY